jgi:hypothetical protein
MDESPGHGMVRTSWHQVQYAQQGEDLVNPISVNQNAGSLGGTAGQTAAATAGGMQARGPVGKKYFIRFDVTVGGGRPWHIKVVGHASEWEPGAAMPVELHGIAKPPWLEGRTDALIAAIYKRVKAYAIPMKEDAAPTNDNELPRTDPASFKNVPPAAAKALALLQDALSHRDYASLRPLLADDVRWSLGAEPGAETALAMWQADGDTLDAMEHLIVAGCALDGDRRVLCPGGEPIKNTYQLGLEPRGDSWKVTSFIKAE